MQNAPPLHSSHSALFPSTAVRREGERRASKLTFMSTVRVELWGNFLPLRDAVDAVSRLTTVSVEQIDARRSLNLSSDEHSFETKLDRAKIGGMLRQAHAADRLLHLLNQEAETRPKWRELSHGYAVLNDTLGLEGVGILIQLAKQAFPSSSPTFGKWAAGHPPASQASFQPPRWTSLGFDLDEFIRFLESNNVPHTLGVPVGAQSIDTAAGDQQATDGGFSARDADAELGVKDVTAKISATEQLSGNGMATVATSSGIPELLGKGGGGSARRTGQPLATGSASAFDRPDLPPLVFRDPLAFELKKALGLAEDPHNPDSVYTELCKLARAPDGKAKWPLLGMQGEDVQYEYKGRPRLFTKVDMAGRYRQLKPKVKKIEVAIDPALDGVLDPAEE